MSVEVFGPKEVTKEPFHSEIVRETTNEGQVVWLRSAPEGKEKEVVVTSSPAQESPID